LHGADAMLSGRQIVILFAAAIPRAGIANLISFN
jgi:hypothetical protein